MKLFYLAVLTALFNVSCTREPISIKPVTAQSVNEVIRNYAGKKAVLVNVWATWCGPCVEEFPDLVKLAKKYPDQLAIVFVSADFPEQTADVLSFLEKQGVTWTTYIKDDADEAFIENLDPQWTGAIPATAVYNTRGEKVAFWENKATFDTFEKTVLSAF